MKTETCLFFLTDLRFSVLKLFMSLLCVLLVFCPFPDSIPVTSHTLRHFKGDSIVLSPSIYFRGDTIAAATKLAAILTLKHFSP